MSDLLRTVGVEEELLLVGPGGVPIPVGARVERSAEELEHELKLEQIEIASEPHREVDPMRAELTERRRVAAEAAAGVGARVVALGTAPEPVTAHPTPDERYQRMAEAFGMVAVQQLTCGQHVHVAVESRAEGVHVLNRIRPWLPVLRAVSANSPFWRGADTSYASFRTVLWGQWPTSGPTELFNDDAGYDAAVDELIASGAALDPGMIYFDARLSAKYRTVEIRVADVCTDVEDALLIAALCRALVHVAAADGAHPPRVSTTALRAATWRAARYGLTGRLVDPRSASTADAWTVLDGLVDHVRPALHTYGDEALVETALARLRHNGTGAERQRRAYAESHSLRHVITDAADRTLR